MELLDSIIEALRGNTANISALDSFRLNELYRRMAPSFKKSTKESNTAEEYCATTMAAGFGGQEIRSELSADEIQCIKEYIAEIEGALEHGSISDETRKKLREKLDEARKTYDVATRYIDETITGADAVVRDVKTYKYTPDPSDRKSKLKTWMNMGKNDPYYDKLHEIYGEEGLEGYRNERKEAFKNILDDDVKWASKRYKKVYNALSVVKTIAQLGTFAASWVIFPQMAINRNEPSVIRDRRSGHIRNNF